MQGLGWRIALLLGLAGLVGGCASRITNLTPTVLPREASGLYHFEAEWTSTQRSRELRQDSIQAYVVLGAKFYPMERVPLMTNRWETEVPLPEDKGPVYHYRFKWDYQTAGFGGGVPNSLRSGQYRLEVVDGLR